MARAWKARGSQIPRRFESCLLRTSTSSVLRDGCCMNWYTYILLCDQKIYYVGMTSDVDRRVVQHKEKGSIFTKKFSEIELVYSEISNTKALAEKREKQLKGWSFAKRKALIEGRLEKLIKLSRST
jgi:putative endonuclease